MEIDLKNNKIRIIAIILTIVIIVKEILDQLHVNINTNIPCDIIIIYTLFIITFKNSSYFLKKTCLYVISVLIAFSCYKINNANIQITSFTQLIYKINDIKKNIYDIL